MTGASKIASAIKLQCTKVWGGIRQAQKGCDGERYCDYWITPSHLRFIWSMNASNFVIGWILVQDGHTITYESRKFSDTKQRYTVQEKEMTGVVHYLLAWRHYLFGSKFVVKTDNITTSYFQMQKLSPKQAQWQDFLLEFGMCLKYKLGKENHIVDALGRKAELAVMCQLKGNLLDRIKIKMIEDLVTQGVVKLTQGKTRKCWLIGGLFYTKAIVCMCLVRAT